MAGKIDHLPIYRDTLEVLDGTMAVLHKIPKLYRYTLGERMLNLALDMLALVYAANRHQEKLPYIEELLDKQSMLIILFRLANRWHAMDADATERLILALVGVEEHAERWRIYHEKASVRPATT